jgi:hypothetical protein
MRRRPAILLWLALALLIPACGGGDDDGGGTTSTADDGGVLAEQLWYTDWEAGVVARWDLAADAPLGVTEVGLSADLIDVGLGWVWVTDCMGGQLVRMDIASGEVTGRIPVGGCPSDMAIAFDLVWLALPGQGTIVAVHPETGAIVAEGTSDLDTVVFLEAGSLDAVGDTYYWKVDEVDPKVNEKPWAGGVWKFKIEDAAANQTQAGGPILAMTGPATSGNDAALLVGPPPGGPTEFDDPAYTTQLMVVGPDGKLLVKGGPWQGFYNYLAASGGWVVGISKMALPAMVTNGTTTVQVPLQSPGSPAADPPPDPLQVSPTYYWKVDELNDTPPGSAPWMWVPQHEPGNVVAIPLGQANPVPVVVATPVNQFAGQPVGVWNIVVLGGNQIGNQAGLAAAMDPSLFPVGIIPDDHTGPGGPRFSSCSVGYERMRRAIVGLEAAIDPGSKVLLSARVGEVEYPSLGTATADDTGKVVFPELLLDDLTPSVPAGAVVIVVYTPEGSPGSACELEVET